MQIEDTSQYAGVIYGLHSGDFDFRYIGLTKQRLSERIRSHRKEARGGNPSAVYRWMRKHGESVQVCVIETFDAESVQWITQREIFHIAQARAYNGTNLNLTDGGDGWTGHSHTEATKAKLREARSKQVFTEETRAKMSAAHMGNTRLKGHKHSEESKARISQSLLANKDRISNGGHIRWHASRNITNPNCKLCKEV